MPSPILVVSAVRFEHAELAAAASAVPCHANPYDFMEGKLGKVPLAFLATGIGPAAAAGALGAFLATRPVRAVLNVGIAGTYSPRRYPIGSACLVTSEIFGDLGAEGTRGRWIGPSAMGFPLLPGGGGDSIPCHIPSQAGPGVRPGWGRTVGLTAGAASHTLALAARRRRRTGAGIETMEGAAFALVSARHGVPFVELRGISNRAGDRDKRGWRIAAAAAAAQVAARVLIEAGGIP